MNNSVFRPGADYVNPSNLLSADSEISHRAAGDSGALTDELFRVIKKFRARKVWPRALKRVVGPFSGRARRKSRALAFCRKTRV